MCISLAANVRNHPVFRFAISWRSVSVLTTRTHVSLSDTHAIFFQVWRAYLNIKQSPHDTNLRCAANCCTNKYVRVQCPHDTSNSFDRGQMSILFIFHNKTGLLPYISPPRYHRPDSFISQLEYSFNSKRFGRTWNILWIYKFKLSEIFSQVIHFYLLSSLSMQYASTPRTSIQVSESDFWLSANSSRDPSRSPWPRGFFYPWSLLEINVAELKF